MSSNSILLKNGIVLIHDANNHVLPTKSDILVQNGRIIKLMKEIDAPGAEIVDCADKIISPGFIDTHHHGWQTHLKGRHANQQLLEYMVTGMQLPILSIHTQRCILRSIAGMLEAVAAGTTTVVDHAHITRSPEHVKFAIAGIASSGIRGVYCYTPMPRVKSWNPMTFHDDILANWIMETFEKLTEQAPFGNGRVSLGFAFDLWFLGKEVVNRLFQKVYSKRGVKTITVHGPTLFNVTQTLDSFGLLDERILISHGGHITREESELIKAAGAHLSSTPSTELQMAMGRPLCFDASFQDDGTSLERAGLQDCASLGVDCHSNNAGSVLSEARIGLQNARNHFNEHYMKQGLTPRNLPENLSVEGAFNLATIKGAEAARMEKEIGRIAEGYKADLVVFNALSPAMVGAAQHDPVAAIILHSSPADIHMVIVDGVVRLRDGKLAPVSVDEEAQVVVEKSTLEWSDIAREIVKSREVIQKDIEQIDVDEGLAAVMKLWHMDERKSVKV